MAASPEAPPALRAGAPDRSRSAQLLRRLRPVHRYAGLGLAMFLIVTSVTGVLLGWKKDADWLQPPSQRGESAQLGTWLPLESLRAAATESLLRHRGLPPATQLDIERMDVRPDRGVVKVRFEPGYWEVQLDGTTAAVLSIGRRHADWIEKVHDGSIISDGFKLIYMNVAGIGLLLIVLTGGWLWYGPRRMRRDREPQRQARGRSA